VASPLPSISAAPVCCVTALAHGSALAQFLRARRTLVQPADVGLPASGRRRVAGLRREEVAVRAGISTDYYIRLEQGREDNPSDQVLDAIARALQLDDDAVAYMRNLMRHQSAAGRTELLQQLHPAIGALLDGWPLTAAHVFDPSLTVVVANRLATAPTHSPMGSKLLPYRSWRCWHQHISRNSPYSPVTNGALPC
jgi:transcriptional regulator with XRE-family HTH domain